MKDRIAGLLVLVGVLLTGTLLFRHDDGSKLWNHLSEAFAGLGNWLRAGYVALFTLLLVARFRPALAAHALRVISLCLLGLGIYLNVVTIQSVPAQKTYKLARNDQHTLLAHAESSPSEYERTHLAFYLALERVVAHRSVIVPEEGLLDRHYVTRVSRARSLKWVKYDATLSTETFTSLQALPSENRIDGRGRTFVIFKTPDRTNSIEYELFRYQDSWVLVPMPNGIATTSRP